MKGKLQSAERNLGAGNGQAHRRELMRMEDHPEPKSRTMHDAFLTDENDRQALLMK